MIKTAYCIKPKRLIVRRSKVFVILLSFLFLASSSGPNFCTHAFDNAGDVIWTTPSNAQAEDGSFATTPTTNGLVSSLGSDTYGFAISAGATITGLQAEVKIKTTVAAPTGGTWNIAACNGGVNTGSIDIRSSVTTTLTWVSAGGSSELWGTTWTPSDVNAVATGIDFDITSNGTGGTVDVDALRLTVYYTTGGGTHRYKVIGMAGHPPETIQLN